MAEHAVAVLVTVRVVHELEVVEVEHHEREGTLVPLRVGDLLAQATIEVATVEEARQSVVGGVVEREPELVLELALRA